MVGCLVFEGVRMNLVKALVMTLMCTGTAWAEAFVDPAPPRVEELNRGEVPKAQVQGELTFRGAPKPLAKDAVVENWPSFLGLRHNGVSSETKLLKTFPKEGPKVVWEVRKGDGYAAPAVVGERLVLFHRVADVEV